MGEKDGVCCFHVSFWEQNRCQLNVRKCLDTATQNSSCNLIGEQMQNHLDARERKVWVLVFTWTPDDFVGSVHHWRQVKTVTIGIPRHI